MADSKKRKRDSEAEIQDSEKATLPNNVKVRVVEGDKEWCPVFASTQGVSFPDITFNSYKKHSGGSVFSDARLAPASYLPPPVTYELLLQSSSHPKLDFTGKEEGDSTLPKDQENSLTHYVGIYDPEASTLQVVPSRKIILRSTPRTEAEEIAAEAAARKSLSFAAARNELGMEFGSKRAKKAISATAQNAITAAPNASAESEKMDATSAALLNSAAEATKNNPSSEALKAQTDEHKPRPKANLEAQMPQDVYSADDLIGPDVMKALQVREWIESAENDKPVQISSRFVAKRLHGFAKKKDVKTCKILRYMLLLMEFSSSLKGIRKKVTPKTAELKTKLRVGDSMIRHLESTFTDSGLATRWHQDYLATHLCALALIIDNCHVDVHDLREDLRIEDKHIVQYFRETGARVTAPTEAQRGAMHNVDRAAAASHKIAHLRIPLDFPIDRRPAKRGAGRGR
ncbi:MAG: DNA-directed RNA polymerase I subunit rpa49 [Bogoriella megaspora]|nr:MAG: DNA-directed RNA polymerase I subunit rpa49 [Bogoriella megaspora]